MSWAMVAAAGVSLAMQIGSSFTDDEGTKKGLQGGGGLIGALGGGLGGGASMGSSGSMLSSLPFFSGGGGGGAGIMGGSEMASAAPSLFGGGYNFADSGLGGAGDMQGLSMGAPGGGGGMGDILKTLGFDNPKGMTSALGGGLDLAMKNRQLQIASQNANKAYAVAPGIHSGNATPVKVGMPLARKMSPLEEFSLLMRGRG